MSIDTAKEAALLPALKQQDEQSFNQLVGMYYGAMIGLARSMVGDAIADEVVQEAWVSVYRALPRFEGRSSLKTWILRITANEARTRLRKESRTIAVEGLSPGGDGVLTGRFADDGHWTIPPSTWHEDSPDTLLTSTEMRDCIELTMGRLPELQQAVFVLKDLEDYGFEEICNILQISASNARVLLHRARISLFGKIEHFQDSGEC
ncbi:RNA polymerase sigma factor [Motiliproteus sediminis]|uniref:RNA polymerase sigma factor n=1 Tax=Motiliproteus sediminis TaxID=1468178 RepID=UPI001AEF3761|nr:RNA polymerase sigma factor [Motiliproteus sediminis]